MSYVSEQELLNGFARYIALGYPYLSPVVQRDLATMRKAISDDERTVAEYWEALIAAGRMQGLIALTPYTSLARYFADIQNVVIEKLCKYDMHLRLRQ